MSRQAPQPSPDSAGARSAGPPAGVSTQTRSHAARPGHIRKTGSGPTHTPAATAGRERTILRLFTYLSKKHAVYCALLVVLIAAQCYLDLRLPDYIANLTQLVETEGSQVSEVLIQGGYMLLCALGSMALAIVVCLLASQVASAMAMRVRAAVYGKTLSLNPGELHQFSTASLINRCTNDITQVQAVVAMGLQVMVKSPIMAVWAVAKIAGKSWQWTTATAVAVAVLIGLILVVFIMAIPRFNRIQELTDDINLVMRESLGGIRVLRAYNAQAYQQQKFKTINEDLRRNHTVITRVMQMVPPMVTFANSGLTLAVYWIGAYLIAGAAAATRLDIFADMVVFSNYAMQVLMSFMMLNIIFVMLPRAQVSARRILAVIDAPAHIKDGTQTQGSAADDKTGTVEFRNVDFCYPGSGGTCLENISFVARPGQTVAFIGATGSGKTSLVNLIPRLYDASAGQVLVDGRDVREWQLKELRSRIGYVTQKAELFSGTVAGNVAFGRTMPGEGPTPATMDLQLSHLDPETRVQVDKALEVSQSDGFVQQMDGGLQAPIAQEGTNVSGGQKQRLSVARALAADPEILIFDDCFSALDFSTDKALRQQLQEQYSHTTRLIVAQRIGTIRDASCIVVLDHGRVVGQGTHEELLQNCPTYQEIAQSQLSEKELAHG